PAGVLLQRDKYPDLRELREAIEALSEKTWFLDATDIALKLGAVIVTNIIMLALSIPASSFLLRHPISILSSIDISLVIIPQHPKMIVCSYILLYRVHYKSLLHQSCIRDISYTVSFILSSHTPHTLSPNKNFVFPHIVHICLRIILYSPKIVLILLYQWEISEPIQIYFHECLLPNNYIIYQSFQLTIPKCLYGKIYIFLLILIVFDYEAVSVIIVHGVYSTRCLCFSNHRNIYPFIYTTFTIVTLHFNLPKFNCLVIVSSHSCEHDHPSFRALAGQLRHIMSENFPPPQISFPLFLLSYAHHTGNTCATHLQLLLC
ncbi:hypothetical protein LCGC14_0677380, partial [marine sediment metagenome]